MRSAVSQPSRLHSGRGAMLAAGVIVVGLTGCPRKGVEPPPPDPTLAEALPGPSPTSTAWLGGSGKPNLVLEVLDKDAPPATITVELYLEGGGGEGGGVESWDRVEDLSAAGPEDKVFSVEPRADGTSLIRFGDGKHGAIPRAGDKVFRIRYAGGSMGHGGGEAVRELNQEAPGPASAPGDNR